MNLDQDLRQIAQQEARLQFQDFSAHTAWQIGSRLRHLAAERQLGVAIEIEVNGHTLFTAALPGATPDNADWIRRKRNVTRRFLRSSYAIGLQMAQKQTTLTEQVGADVRDYATHGGCFPINIIGTGCVGTITVSGLPQRADHELIVEVLAEYFELPLQELALANE